MVFWSPWPTFGQQLVHCPVTLPLKLLGPAAKPGARTSSAVEAQVDGLGQEPVDAACRSCCCRDLAGQLRAWPGDEHAQAGPRVQHALPLQLGVDPGDRVRIDHQRPRQLADRRQPLLGLELAPRDRLANLAGQLPAIGSRLDGSIGVPWAPH